MPSRRLNARWNAPPLRWRPLVREGSTSPGRGGAAATGLPCRCVESMPRVPDVRVV